MIENSRESSFPRFECLVLSVLLPLTAALWVFHLGGGTLSWDGYNHHLYLGEQALTGSRLLYDVFAAGGMSCQYPLGYLPLVAMLKAGMGGTSIFIVLAILAGLIGPAVWWMTWRVLPHNNLQARCLRINCFLLAFSGVLWWKVLPQSSNDTLAMVPGAWSLAFALEALVTDARKQKNYFLFCALSGMLSGFSVVIKLTMFVAPAAALAILSFKDGKKLSYQGGIVFLATATAAGIVSGGAWGMESMKACGTPIYPFLQGWFSGDLG